MSGAPAKADTGGQAFALRCFSTPPSGVALGGRVVRQGAWLQLEYQLQDPQGLVRLPAAAAPPQRRDGLWTSTCLELFLAEPGAAPYWEVNLSPSGDWNLYRLAGYRQGLAADAAIRRLPFAVERSPGGLQLELRLDLSALVPSGCPLELAPTAVLADRAGAVTYWALVHPGPEADFHRRDGFVLRL